MIFPLFGVIIIFLPGEEAWQETVFVLLTYSYIKGAIFLH